MHKKRIRDSFYYYTTIRNGEKTDSVYLGRNFFEARKKEIFLKNIRLNLIVLFLFLVSIGIVFADTIPINVRPLSGGSIQASAAFDYQFNFTSNQDCSTILHSVTKTITTDKYGIGFFEIDVSPLNDTPSYLCEYRALTGGALALRKVHNISTGLFNRSFGKNVKYDKLNITGNLTLGQKTTFSLGSFIQEISNWFISSTSLAVQGDLNVTGNVNVTGYVNASTVYSGGTNVSIWMYNATAYALTVTSTNVSALNASLLAYINANITNLNASITYNYNQSNYILTITNTNFTALNESVTKWLYNMSDGSYNVTYEGYNTSYGPNWYNHTSATSSLINTASTNLQSNVSAVNTSLMTYVNNNITNLNASIQFNYNETAATLTITNANFTALNASVTKWLYNQTWLNPDYLNVTNNLNATNISSQFINVTTLYVGIQKVTDWLYNQTLATLDYISTASINLQSNISAVNTSLMTYVNANITNLNASLIYNYNTTTYALTVISTNVSALNASLLVYINANITNLNASLVYNYNESNYILTITNTNFTALNESVTKWLYNMTWTNYDRLNVTNLLNATNITTTNITIGDGGIFWNGSNIILYG